MKMVFVFAAVVVGIGVTSGAAAQERAAGEAADEQAEAESVAQRLFERGYRAYSDKSYAEALGLWRKAYEYVPEAVFLYNSANAASKLGNLDEAIGLARRAARQEERPLSDELVRKNDALIAKLEDRIERREERRAMEEAKGLDWRGWSGVGAVGAGTALAAVALGHYGREASALNAELTDAPNRDVYKRRRDQMEKNQRVGRVFLFSGATLAAAGAGFLMWDLLDRPQDRKLSFGIGAACMGASCIGAESRLGASVGIRF